MDPVSFELGTPEGGTHSGAMLQAVSLHAVKKLVGRWLQRGDILHLPHEDASCDAESPVAANGIPVMPKVWAGDWILFASSLRSASVMIMELQEEMAWFNLRFSPGKSGFIISEAAWKRTATERGEEVTISVDGCLVGEDSSLTILGLPMGSHAVFGTRQPET